MSTAIQNRTTGNGVDPAAIRKLVHDVKSDPRKASAKFEVATRWLGGMKSETRVSKYELGGRHIEKDFSILADEPKELLGENTQPNPQELLMAAFNACMLVGYVAGATANGITLESLSIESEGKLDVRGFLGLDAKIHPGYDEIRYTVRIKGDGSAEQFRQIHENVIATSPNRWMIANPIKLTDELVVE